MVKNKIEVISEVAQGYLGDVKLARQYIDAASYSKANSIKFQLVYADELATKDYKFYKLFKNLEIKYSDWQKLNKYSKKKKIKICFDIFGSRSLKIAEKLNINCIKIHPTDLTNYDLLHAVNNSKINKIILGIGGSSIIEIDKALKCLTKKKITIMYGFQGYPTLDKDNFLCNISVIKNKYLNDKNFSMGFADHETPESNNFFLTTILSIGMGVKMLEKHITISKIMKLEDYESAINPDEFFKYVKLVRRSENIMNINSQNFSIKHSKKELKYAKKVRRNYIAKKNLKKKSVINDGMFVLKRSSVKGALISPIKFNNKILKRDIKKGHPILQKDLSNK